MPQRSVHARDVGEAQFRAIVESNADAIVVLRGDGLVCYANRAAAELLGPLSDRFSDDRLLEALRCPGTNEIELQTVDARLRCVEMRVAQTIWEGQPALMARLHDVTQRKHAADALRFLADASQKLAGSLASPETVAAVGRLAVAHLADWCAIDLIDGCRLRRTALAHADLNAVEQVAALDDVWQTSPGTAGLAAALISGEPVICGELSVCELARLIGSPNRIAAIEALGGQSLMIVPLLAHDRTIGAISFVRLSAARRFQPADLALAADLAQRGALALDNARLYEEGQTDLRHRDQFLAMLAHELRNPLAALLSAVELVRHAADQPPVVAQAEEVIDRQGHHIARLLDDLLDISRVTRGKIELRKRPLEIGAVMRGALETTRSLVVGRQHKLMAAMAPELLWVYGDPIRLEQIFHNLLHNAAKYMAPGGTIRVTVTGESEEVVLCVEDTGAGIAAADMPYIFDLFMQVDRALDRSQGGLGVGLTLVRHMVEMHGGTVSAQSAGEGQGSRFVVRLPRAIAPRDDSQKAKAPSVSTARRIVLVEDNHDAREMLRALLAIEGHEVQVAEDGREGLALIEGFRPEIALIDIGLPLMDGHDMARSLRASAGANCPFLVAITGYGQPEDRRRALAAGFDEHLVKPIDYDALAGLLARLAW